MGKVIVLDERNRRELRQSTGHPHELRSPQRESPYAMQGRTTMGLLEVPITTPALWTDRRSWVGRRDRAEQRGAWDPPVYVARERPRPYAGIEGRGRLAILSNVGDSEFVPREGTFYSVGSKVVIFMRGMFYLVQHPPAEARPRPIREEDYLRYPRGRDLWQVRPGVGDLPPVTVLAPPTITPSDGGGLTADILNRMKNRGQGQGQSQGEQAQGPPPPDPVIPLESNQWFKLFSGGTARVVMPPTSSLSRKYVDITTLAGKPWTAVRPTDLPVASMTLYPVGTGGMQGFQGWENRVLFFVTAEETGGERFLVKLAKDSGGNYYDCSPVPPGPHYNAADSTGATGGGTETQGGSATDASAGAGGIVGEPSVWDQVAFTLAGQAVTVKHLAVAGGIAAAAVGTFMLLGRR